MHAGRSPRASRELMDRGTDPPLSHPLTPAARTAQSPRRGARSPGRLRRRSGSGCRRRSATSPPPPRPRPTRSARSGTRAIAPRPSRSRCTSGPTGTTGGWASRTRAAAVIRWLACAGRSTHHLNFVMKQSICASNAATLACARISGRLRPPCGGADRIKLSAISFHSPAVPGAVRRDLVPLLRDRQLVRRARGYDREHFGHGRLEFVCALGGRRQRAADPPARGRTAWRPRATGRCDAGVGNQYSAPTGGAAGEREVAVRRRVRRSRLAAASAPISVPAATSRFASPGPARRAGVFRELPVERGDDPRLRRVGQGRRRDEERPQHVVPTPGRRRPRRTGASDDWTEPSPSAPRDAARARGRSACGSTRRRHSSGRPGEDSEGCRSPARSMWSWRAPPSA